MRPKTERWPRRRRQPPADVAGKLQTVKLGIHFMNFTLPGGPAALAPTIAATARAADEGGCSNFTLMDHYLQMEQYGGACDPMLEGYTTLGYLAGVTENLKLGLLVTGVTYRRPGLLAKIVTTLDVLSEGRAVLGLGTAWYEREHTALGVPLPPMTERYEMLEETILICRQMWSESEGPFNGKHFQLAETICVPPPIQPGGPTVLIGGSGEKKTLCLVARHANACNLFSLGLDVVEHKLNALAGHCETEGTDYDAIEKTMLYTGPSTGDPLANPDAFLATMEQYAALGIEKVWVTIPGEDPVGWVEQMCERTVPQLETI